MNLRSKKKLIARTLGVGADRIILGRPEDIKEAITRQDIRDLAASGIIIVKSEKGRKTIERKKSRKGKGNIRKVVGTRKESYINLTRKLRRYAKDLKAKNKINLEKYLELRKKIKSKEFRSLAYMQEYIKGASK